MTNARIEINMSKMCPKCGRPGTANGGPCLKCVLAAMKKGGHGRTRVTPGPGVRRPPRQRP